MNRQKYMGLSLTGDLMFCARKKRVNPVAQTIDTVSINS